MRLSKLPPLIPSDRLADACREVAGVERVQPAAVEKDYCLTRLITALADEMGEGILLKGGTLLSKVDLRFNRMSEDVDLVLPGVADTRRKRPNALRMDALRSALVRVCDRVGVVVAMPHGDRQGRDAHVRWEVNYDSEFETPRIIVEATIRPVMQRAANGSSRRRSALRSRCNVVALRFAVGRAAHRRPDGPSASLDSRFRVDSR